MNLSELIDEDNETFELFDVNETEQQQQNDFTEVYTFYHVVQYICITLGIPGNILSAIVWLRLHVASKNSSAVYLAALAINDLVFLLEKVASHIHQLRTHLLAMSIPTPVNHYPRTSACTWFLCRTSNSHLLSVSGIMCTFI